MGLFGKNKQMTIYSPVSGTTVSMQSVPDETFSLEILGKGIAIIPDDNRVFAPCDATVDLMFETGHAVNIITKNGVEMLIHIGIDTVKLKGSHFQPHVKTGDTVKRGDLLITFDKRKIEQEGFNPIIPIVICSMGEYSTLTAQRDKRIKVGDAIIILKS